MRISFDLDKTLFVDPESIPVEPELQFPFNKIYKDRLRLGAASFLKELSNSTVELWLYSASDRSERYIRSYFNHYDVKIDRLVFPKKEPELSPANTTTDIHVDDKMTVYHNGDSFVYDINGSEKSWTDIIRSELENIRITKLIEKYGQA